MSGVVWLDDVREPDRDRVGSKAFTLAVLRRQGLPVPEGFVLPAGGLEGHGREAVAAAYGRLGGAVAVRSSSSAEDGPAASFAGQHRTMLDVQGTDAVVAAAHACLASARDGDAYAAAMSAPRATAMAVLIQRFVEPRASGVAFTRHPLEPDSLVVESHRGRGDDLVSGRVTPDRYVVARSGGGVRSGPVEGSLGPDEVLRIAALALKVEARLGAPQDVEWALAAQGLVVLQARPITVEPFDALDPRIRRLTRANVGEVLPDPVTPLTATTLVSALEQAFRAASAGMRAEDAPPFLVVHRRRLYLNLGLCVEVAARLPGMSLAAAERLVLGEGASRPDPVARQPRVRAGLAAAALRILRMHYRLPRDVAACEDAIARLPRRADVEAADPEVLAALLDGFLGAGRLLAATHVAASGACAVRLAVLARLLSAWAPGEAHERLNRLVAGLDDLESAQPVVEIERLAAEAAAEPEWSRWVARGPEEAWASLRAGQAPTGLASRLRAFLEKYGHRAVAEGELSASPWADDPRPVLAALGAFLAAPGAAAWERRARRETRRADEEALFSRVGPARRFVLGRALDGTRNWVRRRERTKSLCIAAVHHGRVVARTAGARLVATGALRQVEDVFFLTSDELLSALRGGAVNAPALARRRRAHLRESALPAPREIDLEVGGESHDASGASPPGATPPPLAGVGVSAGVGLGRARVVTAGQAQALLPGEVLVAPVLDAGLGPLLASAAGAVAEMGGLLSHGSVVARELGVPCVVDVRGATERIRTGDLVEVDGGSGRVRTVGAAEAGEAAAAVLPAVDPGDEALHDLSEYAAAGGRARESVYFNAQDPAAGVVLVSSLGLGTGKRGEGLLALGLPDGRVLFGLDLGAGTIARAEWRVGGQTVAWRPSRLRVEARLSVHEAATFPPGPVALLLSPRTEPVAIDLTLSPQTPAVDFCASLPDDVRLALSPLGSHHVEQSGTWRGTVAVDGRPMRFEGSGSRDHSWGLRDWESADHWRLFTATLGGGLALHALVVSVRGRLVQGGFLWRDGRAERVTRVAFAGERTGGILRSFDLEVGTAAGRPLLLRGTVHRTIRVPVQVARNPLRHLAGRPYRLVLHENFTRYACGDLRGFGMAELTERPGPGREEAPA